MAGRRSSSRSVAERSCATSAATSPTARASAASSASSRAGAEAALDGVEAPLAGDTFQRGPSPVLELDPGARDEIVHRPGDEHFSGSRLAGHARPDVHGDPGQLVACDLALTGVDAGTDVEPEPGRGVDRGEGAANCACRPVESRKKAVI